MLIPAFNEGQVIGDVIAEVRRNCDWPIYVIDDATVWITLVIWGPLIVGLLLRGIPSVHEALYFSLVELRVYLIALLGLKH